MDKSNSVFRMISTLVIIAVVLAAALAVVNQKTAPLIEQNSENQLQESLRGVMDADEFTITKENDDLTVYEAKKGGQTVGYCVVNTEKGYGGDVKVMTGVDLDGKVTAIDILEHSETPGLGANSTKDEFKNQFKGKQAGIEVVKNSPKDNDIQAISGATITSKAVTRAVNAAIEQMKEAAK